MPPSPICQALNEPPHQGLGQIYYGQLPAVAGTNGYITAAAGFQGGSRPAYWQTSRPLLACAELGDGSQLAALI